ncbi:hypothetical protein D9757_003755 [Collybiopsis confluens]|uniref:Uncharacterized protein n=1 Tax=Collybiopsis confluens TaxID=2823264 RepID=A0A8H5HVK8_9AGAR|nr:hypothetical protein D9757_003755 [Collybiopsis confluens]
MVGKAGQSEGSQQRDEANPFRQSAGHRQWILVKRQLQPNKFHSLKPMDKIVDILAAFDAGKLPSHEQITDFLEWLKTDVVSNDSLSSQGKNLAQRLRDVITAYQALGEHKNKDNILQDALWHLKQGDLSDASINTTVSIDSDEAAKDLQNSRESIRTILSIIWSGLSSESSSLFQDFASFTRLSLADAAEVVEKQAARAKSGLREIDEEVQQGSRDTLGRDKERLKQEEDTQVAFEHGMDTLKSAGSTVISAGRESAAKASELSDRTSSQLHNSFYRMCERAQQDDEYHRSIDTLFSTLRKWITTGFNATTEAASSLDSFVEDPTPEKHITKALQAIETLVSRLAHQDLSALVNTIRKCAVDVRDDQDLRTWFNDFFNHLHRDLDESGYVHSDEAKRVRKDLRTRWKEMLDQESDFGRSWKRDVAALKVQIKKFQDGIRGDEDLNRLRDAHLKLGDAIESGLLETGSQAQTGMQAIMEQVTWFWQDLFTVYLPKALSMMKGIPIPRTEYKDKESELVLENLDISSFNLLPSHVYIRNITDIDIVAPATPSNAPVQPETKTQLGTLTQLHIQAIQFSVSDLSFYYKDKTASIGPSEYKGRLSFTLPPQGIDVDVKLRLIPASATTTLAPVASGASRNAQTAPSSSLTNAPVPAPVNATHTISQRALHRSFHVIEHLDVRITDDFEMDIKECNHSVILAVFKPIVGLRLKSTLEKFVAEQLRRMLEGLDAMAYDISSRADVFRDTGLGSGAATGAAVWSEIGRLRRLGLGHNRDRYTDLSATGTGIVVEERKIDTQTGEVKEGDAKFAMGAEPQILSGEKRGPVGTASESLSKRVKNATGQVLDDTAMDVDPDAVPEATDVVQQAKNIVEDGKKQLESFADTVKMKADVERQRDGWQSKAFDSKA